MNGNIPANQANVRQAGASVNGININSQAFSVAASLNSQQIESLVEKYRTYFRAAQSAPQGSELYHNSVSQVNYLKDIISCYRVIQASRQRQPQTQSQLQAQPQSQQQQQQQQNLSPQINQQQLNVLTPQMQPQMLQNSQRNNTQNLHTQQLQQMSNAQSSPQNSTISPLTQNTPLSGQSVSPNLMMQQYSGMTNGMLFQQQQNQAQTQARQQFLQQNQAQNQARQQFLQQQQGQTSMNNDNISSFEIAQKYKSTKRQQEQLLKEAKELSANIEGLENSITDNVTAKFRSNAEGQIKVLKEKLKQTQDAERKARLICIRLMTPEQRAHLQKQISVQARQVQNQNIAANLLQNSANVQLQSQRPQIQNLTQMQQLHLLQQRQPQQSLQNLQAQLLQQQQQQHLQGNKQGTQQATSQKNSPVIGNQQQPAVNRHMPLAAQAALISRQGSPANTIASPSITQANVASPISTTTPVPNNGAGTPGQRNAIMNKPQNGNNNNNVNNQQQALQNRNTNTINKGVGAVQTGSHSPTAVSTPVMGRNTPLNGASKTASPAANGTMTLGTPNLSQNLQSPKLPIQTQPNLQQQKQLNAQLNKQQQQQQLTPNQKSLQNNQGSNMPAGPSARPNPPSTVNQSMITPMKTSVVQLPPVTEKLDLPSSKPVTDQPERPTLSAGHSIVAPALTTPAELRALTFDVGGDHVLGKRKLRELIHSVMGVENDRMIDGNVEEILVDAADEFVENVTERACRLAKHRKSNKLEPRDLQLHLERNWNMRVPGYSSDEVRSIRRFVPTPSYNQKISGINMSKSVDGKGP